MLAYGIVQLRKNLPVSHGPLLPFDKGVNAAMQNPKAVIRARCREKRQLEGRNAGWVQLVDATL